MNNARFVVLVEWLYDTGVNVIAHPTTLFSVVTRLNGSRRTRRFLQDSTGFAVLSPFWPLRLYDTGVNSYYGIEHGHTL